MRELVFSLIGAAFGGIVSYLVSRRLHYEQKPVKKLHSSSTYCIDLLTDTAESIGKGLELRVDGRLLRDPVVINYTIKSVGREIIKDCQVLVSTLKDDQVVRFQVLVSHELHCDRVKILEQSPNRRKIALSYLNPKDYVILVLLVAPCKSAECVRLEIDAEGAEVEQEPMQADCSVHLPGDLYRAVGASK